MRGREVVLGGAGLIGRALVGHLEKLGREVVSLDLRSGWDLRVREPDLASTDRVWFLAWDTGGAKYIASSAHQPEIFRNNSLISANVFEALRKSGCDFIFTSSQLAGQPTAYGLTKLMADGWARQLGGRIARLWNVYGWESPDVRSHVITDLIAAGLRDGCVRLRTSGKERRRFLYRDDCALALTRFADSQETEAHIAGPRWERLADIAAIIARKLGVDVRTGPDAGSEFIIEPTLAPAGWQPDTSLEDGLERTIREAEAAFRETTDVSTRPSLPT